MINNAITLLLSSPIDKSKYHHLLAENVFNIFVNLSASVDVVGIVISWPCNVTSLQLIFCISMSWGIASIFTVV